MFSLSQALPSITLGPFDKSPIVARFHPNLFQAKKDGHSLFSLPYAMILAIATKDSIYIYRTDELSPIIVLKGMHLATLTDLCWTSLSEDDSIVLVISSTDGFCSVVVFENNELGVLYIESNKAIQPLSQICALEVVKTLSTNISINSLEDDIINECRMQTS